MSEIEIECRASIKRCFDMLTRDLTEALRQIVSEARAAAAEINCEFDSSHWDDGFPVVFWFVSADGPTSKAQKVLPHVVSTVPTDVVYDVRYEDAALDTWAIASEQFVPWFGACWDAAGGASLGGVRSSHITTVHMRLIFRRSCR